MFERRVLSIANLFLVLLALVSGGILYWQLVRGPELYFGLLDPLRARSAEQADAALTGDLQNLPQPLVQRTVAMLKDITRGSIYDRGGKLLAEDVLGENGARSRTYALPAAANVIGYTTGIRTGATGLEREYNTTLLGLDRLDTQIGQLVHAPIRGSDLTLTLDSGLQQAAVDALGERAGGVVVLNAHTGAVLAMASTPGFDPNRIQDQDYVNQLLACDAPACRAPFLNRAAQALYPPGSTWKTVTLIAALDTGQVSPKTVFDFGDPLTDASGKPYYVYRVGGGVIPDPNHSERQLDLAMAYAKSANAAFAKIGDEMKPDVLIDYAARLGFSAPDEKGLSFEIPVSPSLLANDVDQIRSNDLLRAATAIGQGELLTNPLSMAIVILPVLNQGNLPMPYLIETIREPAGLTRGGPRRGQVVRNVIKAETAAQVKDIMITGVKRGYAAGGAVAGLTVGGKTGTAQLGGSDAPHAWYLGWAEKDKQAVIIAVVVENGGEGSVVAAPIFARLAPLAMEVVGEGK